MPEGHFNAQFAMRNAQSRVRLTEAERNIPPSRGDPVRSPGDLCTLGATALASPFGRGGNRKVDGEGILPSPQGKVARRSRDGRGYSALSPTRATAITGRYCFLTLM